MNTIEENPLYKCLNCTGTIFYLAQNIKEKTIDVVCVSCNMCFVTFNVADNFAKDLKQTQFLYDVNKRVKEKKNSD